MFRGRIYVLYSDAVLNNGQYMYYIGSTKKDILERLNQHKNEFKCYTKGHQRFKSSFTILQKDNNPYIDVLEENDFETTQGLNHVEALWLHHYLENNTCLNRQAPKIINYPT